MPGTASGSMTSRGPTPSRSLPRSRRAFGVDVHVLAESAAEHPAEIAADRAIELRNRKVKPLLLLIPAKAGLSASSLDNSFQPLPLVNMLDAVSRGIEKELAPSQVGPLVVTLRRALGPARQAESWARYLGSTLHRPRPGHRRPRALAGWPDPGSRREGCRVPAQAKREGCGRDRPAIPPHRPGH